MQKELIRQIKDLVYKQPKIEGSNKEDSHFSDLDVPVPHFSVVPSVLQVYANLFPVHEGSYREAWRTQGRMARHQTNREMPPMGESRTRSRPLITRIVR
jgi:hypothetical protein